MSVYCVFWAYSDGDGYTGFDLKGVFLTVEDAHQSVPDPSDIVKDENTIHKSANYGNKYTYVGGRSECREMTESGSVYGYVIEHVILGC